jgi:uncharacterized membrane protein YdjX (TVP38/TMEM64 family)
VLEDIGWTLLAYAIAFVINIVPAFMPSTWMVLAFFHIQFDLPILPLTIGGAFFSGLGRMVLAKFSSLYTRHVRKRDKELDEIKTYLDRRRNGVGVATFFYCLLPLPTNSLFVAAGMIEVSMLRVMIGFWAGRAIADTFYVWSTSKAFDSLEVVFKDYYQDWQAIALQLLGLAGAAILLLVPWPRWVFRWINRGEQAKART